MSIPADVIPLPSHTPGAPRFSALRAARLGDVPMIPLVILLMRKLRTTEVQL